MVKCYSKYAHGVDMSLWWCVTVSMYTVWIILNIYSHIMCLTLHMIKRWWPPSPLPPPSLDNKLWRQYVPVNTALHKTPTGVCNVTVSNEIFQTDFRLTGRTWVKWRWWCDCGHYVTLHRSWPLHHLGARQVVLIDVQDLTWIILDV